MTTSAAEGVLKAGSVMSPTMKGQACGVNVVLVDADEPGVPEPTHRLDDREQRRALVRHLVLDSRRRLRVAVADDDPHLLERVEPLGERARTDARAGVLELGEAP